MRKKNDEAKLEIYEVEAMADTVRKDYVSGFIAGIFIGSAAGFILNQVKKRKQQENERKEVKEDQNKASIKDKVNEQKEAIKNTTQDQLDGMKNMVEQIKDAVVEQMKSDEQQETEQKKLRAEKAAIRNEVAAHDLKDVSPKAQEAQKNDNPLASSQDVTTPSHEFTATGNAQAAKAKAKLMASDKNVADKVAELFKTQPVKSSGYTTVPVLVTIAGVAKNATDNKAEAKENQSAANNKTTKQAKPAPKAAEKRTVQTHETAKFDNGVIAHDKATANHANEPKPAANKQVVVTKKEETPTAKVESKTVNNTKTTKSQTTKTTNTPKKTTSTTTKTAKAASSKDATKTTTKTTRKPASKGSKTTTQKTTTKTTKSANGNKTNQTTKNTKQSSSKTTTAKKDQQKSTPVQKGETTEKKIEKKTFND